MRSSLRQIFMLTSLSSVVFSSCYSHDLGSESSDRVPVTLGLTDWSSGAGPVINAKCATCHTSERKPFVPANTPKSLDGMGSPEFFVNRKNSGRIKAMIERVEDGSEGIMPPKYATPLFSDEKVVLISFLKASLEKLDDGQTPPAQPPENPGNGPVKFVDVADIAVANCAKSGCHDGAEAFSLRTREDFFKRKPRPLNAIKRGSMPEDNPDFRDTEDGKKLLLWLMGDQTQ